MNVGINSTFHLAGNLTDRSDQYDIFQIPFLEIPLLLYLLSKVDIYIPFSLYYPREQIFAQFICWLKAHLRVYTPGSGL